ncbi:effector-associated domain EAD1-containing protein [Streptomyces sp. NPDC056660]|uniref:effector-associated domain EAD1-containing protein n=1 Tax=Streptomyces sp. NPDC056660 TaxID=3345897 RepID=UPI0036BB4131
MSTSEERAEAPLFPEEIRALATVYNTPSRAEVLLRSAGYPADALPYAPSTLWEYWEQVSLSLATGVMADGRQSILTKARDRYPHHPVFRGATSVHESHPPSGASESVAERLKVMVLGAEPARRGAVRAAAELREIQSAAADRLVVLPCPAATPGDLEQIRRQRPDILHLACHGDRGTLLLEDHEGEPHSLPAADLVETLRLAAEHYRHRLRALLLRSCSGEEIARLFTGVTDVVIAHRGALDADCSTQFAAAFYRELASRTDPLTPEHLTAAAHLAAQDVVNRAEFCRSLRTDLIILPRTA